MCFSLCHFLSAAFSLFVLYLFVCVAGVGLGSSPTSSQNEALPPSTDWPVSGYTSSFSLSSPEMEDAGTWFIHNHPPPRHTAVANFTASQHFLLLPVTLTPRASAIHWRDVSSFPYESLPLIKRDLHLSCIPVSFVYHAVHNPLPAMLVYLLPPLCAAWRVQLVVFPVFIATLNWSVWMKWFSFFVSLKQISCIR